MTDHNEIIKQVMESMFPDILRLEKQLNPLTSSAERDILLVKEQLRPTVMKITRNIVYNRLRIQRGQAFVGMLFSTITVVGVWRMSLPAVPWWALLIIGGVVYIGLAWLLGLIDEKMQMFKYEQERYSDMNPYWDTMFDKIDKLEALIRKDND